MSGRANKEAGKALERYVASLHPQGRRYPADTGGPVDVEWPGVIFQCKHRAALSLGELTRLVEDRPAGAYHVLAVKHRRGKGVESPVLFVLHELEFLRLVRAAGLGG